MADGLPRPSASIAAVLCVWPALEGGAPRRLGDNAARDSREAYLQRIAGSKPQSLAELVEEAQTGYEHQRQRSTTIEQRANFFLGAAGLTTTLVLANVGLLLGQDALHGSARSWAEVALVFASVCAVAAGLRAIQAMMLTFERTPPHAVTRLVERHGMDPADVRRSYLAALLVAQRRSTVVCNWKVGRLAGARRWFMGVVIGVVALTVVVVFAGNPA